MLDSKLINEKIDLIFRDLKRLEQFREMRFHEAAGDPIAHAAIKNFLMEVIGRGIDINQHIVSRLMKLDFDTPKSYKETFLALGQVGALPKDFAEKISNSASFRNAIVHDYNNLDKEIVYKSVGEAIDQYGKYCEYILDFLKKHEAQGAKEEK